MTTIIDYGTGNLRSVANALSALGEEFTVSGEADDILRADHVILPGVGEAASAMDELRKRSLDTLIPTLKVPVLGICIGMQLMCTSTEEGAAPGSEEGIPCLGIFRTRVRLFDRDDLSPEGTPLKVPEMGWNTVEQLEGPLFESVAEGSFVYYVHSYSPDLCEETAARTSYGRRTFSASLRKDNFFATQFHPEKSGDTGLRILENFLRICR